MRLCRLIAVAAAFICTAIVAVAAPRAVYKVRGVVTDAESGETVPYAQIAPVGTYTKHLTDDNGAFTVNTPRSFTAIIVSALGYEADTIQITNDVNPNSLRINLLPTGVALSEVVAKPKKERYSKKNNPAVEFMRRVKEGGELTDPRRNPYYSFDRYERITLALNHVTDSSAVFRHFPELLQYKDTSDVSGTPILNVSVKEKAAEVHYRRNPEATRTYVHGIRRRGVDDIFDQQAIQTLLEDVLREVDIYSNDINILQNRFVSPLGRLAPDFYKFYLTDTVTVDTARCIVLSFVPRTSESFGFTGRLYVDQGDSTMFVRRIEMNVPHDINLNFIDHLYINQSYARAADGSRLKLRDDMAIEISLLGQHFYTRRNTAYSNHSFEPVGDEAFASTRPYEEAPYAEAQTDEFWESRRTPGISGSEKHMGEMMTTLRSNKFYYWGEKVLHALSTGYVGTRRENSKFDIGPVNTFISGNSLEGVRLRFGGMTTAALSKRLFARGYGAWGTRDHRWKYMAELEWSFIDKRVHPREFPVHSVAVTSKYDVDFLGQHYFFTNADNFVLSLKRKPDHQITYLRENRITYTLELYNNFSVKATFGHQRQEATQWMTFVDGLGQSFSGYNEAYAEVQLRYAPGEKFFQMRSVRVPVNLDAPVFTLTHRVSPRGFMGSAFTVNRTEASVQKRFWLSAFGFVDALVKGGHVWSRSPYPALLIPNANLSYTIQPESFALMNAMEFINDSYVQWDLTYWANGALFNRIPLLKKTKLREVVSLRGVWGHLSHRNRPDLNPDLYRFPAAADTRLMGSTPYMEVSAGLDNIFRILRLDYVWRLTYRDAPGIDRSGLRVALHITF